MTRDIMMAVLESEGFKGGTKGYQVPEDREATCFVSTPGEILSVTRLTRIELSEKVIVLENAKGERHFFAYEDVLGMKLGPATQLKDRAPGFVR